MNALDVFNKHRDDNLVRCAHALAMLVQAFDLPTPTADKAGQRRRAIGQAMEEARAALAERNECALRLAQAVEGHCS